MADPIPAKAVRDRIVDFRRVRAHDLLPHPANWRRHPEAQREALRGMLEEIGYAGALLTRQLPDGRLQIIDGHLRAEETPDQNVPVLVLDVTEGEAEKLLLSIDPLAALAVRDDEAIRALLDRTSSENARVQAFLAGLRAQLPPVLPQAEPLQPKPLPPGFADIRCGHVLEQLRGLPDNSVHCVMTSPPYWGLRDYGIPPVVWDGDPACAHQWGEELTKIVAISDKREEPHQTARDQLMEGQAVSQGAFCQKCGAWRGALGLEPTPALYVQHMVEVFRDVRRVLREDGTLWLNMGDSYFADSAVRASADEQFAESWDPAQTRSRGGLRRSVASVEGLKSKDLTGMPWRVAFALQQDGWWIRSDIIWAKSNVIPESIDDRPTKSHEYLFLMAKSDQYFYDLEAIREESATIWNSARTLGQTHTQEKMRTATTRERALVRTRGMNDDGTPTQHADIDQTGRNKRDVWIIASQPRPEAHFATFPDALVEPPILAGTSAAGCCATCGAPWARIVERAGGTIGFGGWMQGENWREVGKRKAEQQADYPEYTRRDLGWRRTCEHETDPIPCTVLDPFAGSGTTLVVGKRLGRSVIGIELNPEYCALITHRLAELVAEVS